MMRKIRALFATAILFLASAASAADVQEITCEGAYPLHLQGVCRGDDGAIFWSFTTTLVKTDSAGKMVKQVDVANHHGDLCFLKGKVYVAVNLSSVNNPKGNARSWIYVYDSGDLSLVAKHSLPEVIYGAGGVAYHDGRFVVVGGLPEGMNENLVYAYDSDFKFIKRHALSSGYTRLGIQTAAFADGHWWFGCYGSPAILLKADASLEKFERFEFDCAIGLVPVGDGKFLVARGGLTKDKLRTAKLVLAESDKARGLKLASPKK